MAEVEVERLERGERLPLEDAKEDPHELAPALGAVLEVGLGLGAGLQLGTGLQLLWLTLRS